MEKTQEVATLNREEILAKASRVKTKIVRVHVEEWGGEVCMRELTLAEQEEYQTDTANRQNEFGRMVKYRGLISWLLVRVLCNPNGSRLFAKEPELEKALTSMELSGRLYEKALEIAGLEDGAAEAIEAEAEKNSETIQTADSGSESPSKSTAPPESSETV